VLKNRGIAFKLILLCHVSCGLIFLVISAMTIPVSRRMIERDIENQARTLVLATVNRIETSFSLSRRCPKFIFFLGEALIRQERTPGIPANGGGKKSGGSKGLHLPIHRI